jgi:5-dehydro-2-deoxygluconokinase
MQNTTRFAAHRALDVICLGRLGVDLYAQQVGARLEDVTSFAKYLGGSSANIAFGCARLGLRAALLSRVGDDQMGRFLLETLAREGCDISHVAIDPARLTALAILGLKDRATFPLLFYRENCADMALDMQDVDAGFIASAAALLITGTHFSTAQVKRASLQALELARRNDVRTVLDIDYRPVLWGLTGRGEGDNRFVADAGVTQHLQAILPLFDLIVGTEEEFRIAGGIADPEDVIAAVRNVRALSAATLVVKRGALGCCVIDGQGALPPTLDAAYNFRGVQVEVFNVLGAGDAFMAGLLKGWVRGESFARSCAYANACGALVVSRHACAPATPSPAELDYFLDLAARRPGQTLRLSDDAALARLHRVTVARRTWDELMVFAFDHRAQFYDLVRETGAAEESLPALKRLLVRAVAETEQAHALQGRIGILLDGRYGQDALNEATGRGWWIGRPVELPGSNPLEFESGRSIGSELISWPREHVVKCLVQLHPDDEVLNRLDNEAQVQALYQATRVSGHDLLLEVIPPRTQSLAPDTVLRALKRLYNLGIYPDWWKLEPMPAAAWSAIDQLIAERDPYCRGVVMLGLNASVEAMADAFAAARASRSCRGFMVGRTIFHQPSQAWLAGQIDDATLVRQVRATFEQLIDLWRASRSDARRAA